MKLLKVFIAALLISYPSSLKAQEESFLPFLEGEKIVYAIKKLGIKAGEAVLNFNGIKKLDGRDVYVITFTSQGFNFFDEEKIYVDPKSFLPVRVERDLDIFGKKEKITEYYEPDNERVRIVKTAKGKTTEQIIPKRGPIDNIYCFIYRYRRDGRFQIGDTLEVHLPTTDVTLSLVEEKKIKAGGRDFDAFFMQSTPKKYKIWFDSGAEKIPLRIDGAVGFGKTAMIMTEYFRSSPKEKR